jgi:hypothetical protein
MESMRASYQARMHAWRGSSIAHGKCADAARCLGLRWRARAHAQFKKIADLPNTQQRELVDVVGVVQSVNPASSIMRKDGTGTEKRSVYIRDDSNYTIEVTLWTPFSSREGATLEQVRSDACA